MHLLVLLSAFASWSAAQELPTFLEPVTRDGVYKINLANSPGETCPADMVTTDFANFNELYRLRPLLPRDHAESASSGTVLCVTVERFTALVCSVPESLHRYSWLNIPIGLQDAQLLGVPTVWELPSQVSYGDRVAAFEELHPETTTGRLYDFLDLYDTLCPESEDDEDSFQSAEKRAGSWFLKWFKLRRKK